MGDRWVERQVLPANSVRRAEWSEGRLRLLCELPEGQTEVGEPGGRNQDDRDLG